MIISKLQGGLGNQMFQYAFAKNLALKNKTTFKLDTNFLLDRTPRENFVFRDFDLDIFNINCDFLDKSEHTELKKNKNNKFKNFISKITNYEFIDLKEKHFYFEESNFKKNKNIYLDGYWQSEKYFKEIEKNIRNDFSFKYPLSDMELEMNSKILSTNSVCVNFRRTDFVHLKNSAVIHGVLEMDYYEKAIMKISEAIENPNFFIFSDDIEWCIENIKWQFPITFVGHEYKGHKFSSYLQLMKNCKHFVIPNSTFAWWAAWLSQNEDKIVIAPKTWFKDQVLQDQTHDIIPDAWSRI